MSSRKLDELVASFRRLCQEQITGEIIQLSGGGISAADSVKRNRELRSALAALLVEENIRLCTT